MSDAALVVMARYPEHGKVKTRLARSLGADKTLVLYEAFLQDLAQRFAGWKYDLHWAYTSSEYDFSALISSFEAGCRELPCAFPQLDADFGARLLHAFEVMQAAGYQSTILISSDSPHVSRAIIQEAYDALEHADVVLGPAEDGGYYLIAMRSPYDVFSAIPMSTDVVLEMTIAKAKAQDLSVALLEPLFDVDTQQELLRLIDLLEQDSSLAPYTAAYLESLSIDIPALQKDSNAIIVVE
jgi:rSAM/selenodomain-associated transferase 1